MAAIIQRVRPDQLTAPTPCSDTTVGDLLDHIDSLCGAFTAAGTKTAYGGSSPPPKPSASRLGVDWHRRLLAALNRLAAAWQPNTAWTGMTRAGGNEMPAIAAGSAALDELIVHGWDLAVATGQTPPGSDPSLAEAIQAAYAFVQSTVEQNPQGSPGLFGPPVPVPPDAPLMHRLLGLTGRDPTWRPNIPPAPG